MALATLEIANELRPSPRDLGLPEAGDLNRKGDLRVRRASDFYH